MMTMFELVTPLLSTPFDDGLLPSATSSALAIGRVHHAD
jgi:hypothetical protein